MRRAICTALLLALGHASAAPVAPAVRSEIDALLGRLVSSSCQFNRNGAWHDGAVARAHLLRKLEYLEGRNLVRTTEQFIELGASSSSSSGKPYLVKCGAAAAVESQVWLTTELQAVRAAGMPAPAASR